MIRHLALGFALCAVPAAPAQLDPDIVRVGTWNLENLGRREPPRTGDDIRAIATVIEDAGIDVLAVQEIGGPAALERLTAALGERWRFVLGSTGTFRGDGGQIGVGFVWNDARVELLQAEELLDLPREADGLPIFHRVPVSAAFRARNGGLDFRAITVHLKAGSYPNPRPTDSQKRQAEAANLRRYVERLAADSGEDQDVLVLGDFNHTYGEPAHEVMTAGGKLRYLETDGNPSTIVYPQFRNRPIDHIAIARGVEPEYVAFSRRVHANLDQDDTARDRWKEHYSDHAPVSVDLDASGDRDPEARFAPPRREYLLLPGGFAAARDGVEGAPRATGGAPRVLVATPRAQRARAAPRAGGAPPPTELRNVFVAGTAVRVLVEVGEPIRGYLLDRPDRWVQVQTYDGNAVAVPHERVRRIELDN